MADFEYVDVNGRQIRVRREKLHRKLMNMEISIVSQTASRKVLEKGKIR